MKGHLDVRCKLEHDLKVLILRGARSVGLHISGLTLQFGRCMIDGHRLLRLDCPRFALNLHTRTLWLTAVEFPLLHSRLGGQVRRGLPLVNEIMNRDEVRVIAVLSGVLPVVVRHWRWSVVHL